MDQRESAVSRVVGFDEKDEQKLLDYFKDIFEHNQVDAHEKEKPTELENLIVRINDKMADFLEQYGVTSIEIPPPNVHMLDKSKLDAEQKKKFEELYKNNPGLYMPNQQGIVLFRDYEDGNKLLMIQTLVHEMLHMESFNSFQKTSAEDAEIGLIKDDEKAGLAPRRSGFSIRAMDEKKLFFNEINEAIITELMIRFEHAYFSEWPELAKEIKESDEAILHLSNRDNIPIEELKKEIGTVRKNADSLSSDLISYGYRGARKQLWSLVDDLFEKNRSEFKSKEEIFDLFVSATMNGGLLPVARLIEKTYGKGSFREMGEKSAS